MEARRPENFPLSRRRACKAPPVRNPLKKPNQERGTKGGHAVAKAPCSYAAYYPSYGAAEHKVPVVVSKLLAFALVDRGNFVVYGFRGCFHIPSEPG